MQCDRTRFPLPRYAGIRRILSIAAVLLILTPIAVPVLGQSKEPKKLLRKEPKTLLSPVKLLPVEHDPAKQKTDQVAPAAAPPVRLAPELRKTPAKQPRKVRSSADGIRPASFKEITPGKTTREQVVAKFGEAEEVNEADDETTLVYQIGPFPTVQFTLNDAIVQSIVIHLATPGSRDDVKKELNLEDFQPVMIRDDQDRLLGEVYPERGLMFAYHGTPEEVEDSKVGHVVLEKITVEPFLLRALQTKPEEYSRRLSDLRAVQKLSPDDAQAFAMASRIEKECGLLLSSLDSATKAAELEADEADHQLTLAELKHQLGQRGEAVNAVRKVLGTPELSSLSRARAKLLYGRILATAPTHNYKQAMEETVSAVKLAAAHTKEADDSTRSAARQVLIDAELSLAEILAHGPWKQKHKVVPQWLATAEKAANEYIRNDNGPRDVLLDVYGVSLHCLLILEGQGSPSKIADAAIQLGRDLIAEADDGDYQALIEWQLGTALWYAAQVELKQGNAKNALRYANNADALLVSAGHQRTEAPETNHHLGQLHFLIGSIHAIHDHDNSAAIGWYDKALPDLQESYPGSLLDERGLIGDQMVSVGVSLWETGRRNKAIAVTEDGAARMLDAVQDGALNQSTLLVPYQNLAAMHKKVGNETESARLAKMAAKLEPPKKKATKRR